MLDAVRLGPDDDQAEVSAEVRNVVTRLIAARHWQEGDLAILVIIDAGYDVPRLAYQLADLPVQVLGRLRNDRMLCFAAPPRSPGTNGRPRRHDGEFTLADPASWPPPTVAAATWTTRYGAAVAQA
jgi:DDE superfamily endonuclease